LLLTQLSPDVLLSNPIAQPTLFFLPVLIEIWLFLIGWAISEVRSFCKHVPEEDPEYEYNYLFDILLWLGSTLFGLPIILIYLLWGLFTLALAATVTWMIYAIISTTGVIRVNLKAAEIRKKRFVRK